MIVGPALALLVFFTAVLMVVRWVLVHARLKRESEMQLQLHTRLIDKFGTPKELVEYLGSDAGRAFLTPPPAERAAPFRRVLASAQAGIVLAFVGGTVLYLRDAEGPGNAMQTLTVLGGVTLALGLGFIASAILAYVLSSRWGLFNGKHAPADDAR